jgi:hypothetical protein
LTGFEAVTPIIFRLCGSWLLKLKSRGFTAGVQYGQALGGGGGQGPCLRRPGAHDLAPGQDCAYAVLNPGGNVTVREKQLWILRKKAAIHAAAFQAKHAHSCAAGRKNV